MKECEQSKLVFITFNNFIKLIKPIMIILTTVNIDQHFYIVQLTLKHQINTSTNIFISTSNHTIT